MNKNQEKSITTRKNQEEIINNHKIFVYPRVLTEQEMEDNTIEFSSFNHSNVIRCQAPIMKISSSLIRKAIKNGKDVRYLLTPEVFKYVDEMNFYK